MEHVIKTTGLSYRYSREAQTLFDINLLVEKGSVYGFLGPNGSGKTTTLSLLLGLLNNQQGKIEIFEKDIDMHRLSTLRRIGSLIETPSLYSHLTATENLEVYRRIYEAAPDRINKVLSIVGLEDTGKKTVRKFSLGMKQRLAIALALLPDPELLILDEPTNGLDPSGIIELRLLIRKLNEENGMTILVSSHILSEVEKMATHLGIIYKGKMLFQGRLQDLHALQQKDAKLLINTSDNKIASTLLQEHRPELQGENISIPFKDLAEVAAINRTLTHHGLDVYLLHPKASDLEQLFINLTTNRA